MNHHQLFTVIGNVLLAPILSVCNSIEELLHHIANGVITLRHPPLMLENGNTCFLTLSTNSNAAVP